MHYPDEIDAAALDLLKQSFTDTATGRYLHDVAANFGFEVEYMTKGHTTLLDGGIIDAVASGLAIPTRYLTGTPTHLTYSEMKERMLKFQTDLAKIPPIPTILPIFGGPKHIPYRKWHKGRKYRDRINKKRDKEYEKRIGISKNEYVYDGTNNVIYVHSDRVESLKLLLKTATP